MAVVLALSVGGQYRLGPTPSSDWVQITALSSTSVSYVGVDDHKITEVTVPRWKFESIIKAFREGEV